MMEAEQGVTDVVVTTCERLELLQRTLAYIWERTTTPYRLQVIDDASQGGNGAYLLALEAEGKIARARIHRRRVGIVAHLRMLEQITQSDPLVFTDDDILCPKVEPDWLARQLAAMEQFPELGMLALNAPSCNLHGSRGNLLPGDPVTLCRNIPGEFVCVRRAMLSSCMPEDGVRSPVKRMCAKATMAGWGVGYLTDVYCQHIGALSVRNGRNIGGDLEQVLPVDGETLEPPEEFRG